MTDDEMRDEVMRLHDRAYNPDFEVNDVAGLIFFKALTPEAHAWVEQNLPAPQQVSHEGAVIIEHDKAEGIVNAIEASGMWWMAKP